ncbi:MAG: hypothetical protein CVV56_01240 [Tenericutes bacterium HGW-Tenericutes-1]|nr:MAG: hypothetical protein CVV56_01240 [Tenericutes bacterium HGW-Tenericutes-1]
MNKNITNKKCYFNTNGVCTALKVQEANCRGCIFFRDCQTDTRNNSLMAAFNRQRQADYSAGLCTKPRTRSL